MKQILVFTLLIGCLIVIFIAVSLLPPHQEPIKEERQETTSDAEVLTIIPEPSVPEIITQVADGPPAYVFITQNQLEFQVSPKKRYNERKHEEFQHRFAKLARREKQLEIPVQPGTPLVLAPPEQTQN